MYLSHLFSEKNPLRGCRRCWPNHVKYGVHYCVVSASSLCLVEIIHQIGSPSCRAPSLSGSIYISIFLPPTIGTVCGNRYSKFWFEWELPLKKVVSRSTKPQKLRHHRSYNALVKVPGKRPTRSPVPPVSKLTPSIESSNGPHQWIPLHPIWWNASRTSSPEPPRIDRIFGAPTTRRTCLAQGQHVPAHAKHTPGPRPSPL